MLVFLREPYDIGDRIALSDVEEDTKSSGSSTWFVEGVTLFTTTVRYATTNEVASLANGSLANSRIINAARSPKANVQVYMKFSVNVPYERVQVFRKDVEAFVKALPREWIALNSIRATRVETELGYIEYSVCLTHRKSWQELGVVLQSKADVTGHCLEVSKTLGITFEAPPMPVTLGLDEITAELLFLRREFDSLRRKTGDEKDDATSEETATEILRTESDDPGDLQTFIDSFTAKKALARK
jgi:small-conductance mechanosensitive channel